jgi:hypothetical protein
MSLVASDHQLTLQERARAALAGIKTEEELKALAASSISITAITNPDGLEQCRRARIVLKNTRVAIENIGKGAREDAVKFQKAVLAEQNRLVAILEPEETRLQAIQNAWEAKVEAEKQAKIDAEIARVNALKARTAELHGCLTLTPSSGSTLIQQHIDDLDAIAVDETFEEFQAEAATVKDAALKRLGALWTAARSHEAEHRRLADERADLARQRAEQAERDRIAEQERAAREAQEKRIARERQAELDKQAAANRAEQDRLAAERAALEAERNPPAPEPAPVPPPVVLDEAPKPRVRPAPPLDEILSLIAQHYGVERRMATYWLSTYRYTADAA